ncbi:hypothetical protein LPAF129_17360 [Ligilactobacillus pabuli]|uniref:Uncharacterized protein n=1 Tax=Ligilactobacillus pabuli TaxID=2886039 RepID=A0ABQ5JMY5_9LACO|nr:hypothetical protein [Ligilactobacillus pabuli]GKS82050.1 hypothetical protein LPAF129_17360 [Ligilactobacillus pabuli]
MFERNSLRLISKGKKTFYQAEELNTRGMVNQSRYALLFPNLKAAQDFDQLSRKCHMTIQNFFGSYHEITRTDFEVQKSNLTDQAEHEIYRGLLTVQEVRRKNQAK